MLSEPDERRFSASLVECNGASALDNFLPELSGGRQLFYYQGWYFLTCAFRFSRLGSWYLSMLSTLLNPAIY